MVNETRWTSHAATGWSACGVRVPLWWVLLHGARCIYVAGLEATCADPQKSKGNNNMLNCKVRTRYATAVPPDGKRRPKKQERVRSTAPPRNTRGQRFGRVHGRTSLCVSTDATGSAEWMTMWDKDCVRAALGSACASAEASGQQFPTASRGEKNREKYTAIAQRHAKTRNDTSTADIHLGRPSMGIFIARGELPNTNEGT
jgi:hypothetical protein